MPASAAVPTGPTPFSRLQTRTAVAAIAAANYPLPRAPVPVRIQPHTQLFLKRDLRYTPLYVAGMVGCPQRAWILTATETPPMQFRTNDLRKCVAAVLEEPITEEAEKDGKTAEDAKNFFQFTVLRLFSRTSDTLVFEEVPTMRADYPADLA